jgi:lantibiotic biosynthesis protein
MAARATPFGLFADCAVGRVDTQTRLRLAPRAAQRRHTRLDMQYLCDLVTSLERDPLIRARLRFRISSSLYRLGERWHWIELTPDDERHSHRYRRLPASPWLDRLVELARTGTTLAALATALPASPCSRSDQGIAEAPLGSCGHLRAGGFEWPAPSHRSSVSPLLDALVEQRLLVSELQPDVTGAEPIHALIERLDTLAASAPLAAEAAAALREVRDVLETLDAGSLGAGPDRYRALIARLEQLPAKVNRSKLFQVELVKTTADPSANELVLGPDVLAVLMPRDAYLRVSSKTRLKPARR